jgi:5-methylcytosine-specific restriction protein A
MQHAGQRTFADELAFRLLVERLRLAPDREWIDGYLDLIKLLIEATGLSNDDPRVVTSIPKKREWFLPVSVNNRYILAPLRRKDRFLVGIIYGPEYEVVPGLAQRVVYSYWPLRGEHLDTPVFLGFDCPQIILEAADVREGWIAAALVEVQRARGSPYRVHHQPVVYEAAVNLDYRNEVLNSAFPA